MFNNEEILILAKAGFTAAQIAALAQTAPKQPEPQPAPAPVPEKPADPQPAPAESSELEKTLAQLNKTIADFQSVAILGSNQPAQETIEQILASIINPPNMKGAN